MLRNYHLFYTHPHFQGLKYNCTINIIINIYYLAENLLQVMIVLSLDSWTSAETVSSL